MFAHWGSDVRKVQLSPLRSVQFGDWRAPTQTMHCFRYRLLGHHGYHTAVTTMSTGYHNTTGVTLHRGSLQRTEEVGARSVQSPQTGRPP